MNVVVIFFKFIFQDEQGAQLSVGEQQVEGIEGDFNDGTVLYIDPNDPQAAALLQQAGLTIADDGTVIGGIEEGVQVQEGVQDDSQASEVITADPPTDNQLGTIMEGADNASTEVPQELFMSSDELEVKPGLTLDANEHKIAEDLGAALVRLFLDRDLVIGLCIRCQRHL